MGCLFTVRVSDGNEPRYYGGGGYGHPPPHGPPPHYGGPVYSQPPTYAQRPHGNYI